MASVFHAGDGNLHPLLLFDSRNEEDKKKVMAAGMEVLQVCADLGGTVSGEHGIGIEKLEAMHMVFDDNDLRAQGFVKDAFDPRGLCNPGKVLPGPGAPAPPAVAPRSTSRELANGQAVRAADGERLPRSPFGHSPPLMLRMAGRESRTECKQGRAH